MAGKSFSPAPELYRQRTFPYSKTSFVFEANTGFPSDHSLIKNLFKLNSFIFEWTFREEKLKRRAMNFPNDHIFSLMTSQDEFSGAALQASKIGIWNWDVNSGKINWCEKLESLFGLSANTFSGKYEDYLDLIHPQDRENCQGVIREALASKKPYRMEHRVIWPDGSVRWILGRGQALCNPEGQLICVAGTAVDITERKKHEEALTKKSEELERFAAIVAHDLKSPLNTIAQFSEYLAEKYQPLVSEEDRQYFDFVNKAGRRMGKFIDSLLAYARAGEVYPDSFSQVCMNSLISEVQKNLFVSIKESDIQIEVLGNLPVIRGVEVQLLQLFQNLFCNSIKFRHPGRKAQIQVSCRELEKFWEFTVGDNGFGIESQYLPKIFDFFYRIQNRDKNAADGLGIGLASCQKIVMSHGGTIQVESELGKGSRFTFTLAKQKTSDTEDLNSTDL